MNQGIIFIGSSHDNIKTVDVDSKLIDDIYFVDKTNWVSNDTYNDRFRIQIINGKAICQRLDATSGWGMELVIYANIKLIDHDIPVFYINLPKDTDRLKFINNVLNTISDTKNIFRIEGVTHELGLEGCRLAHIKANIAAINHGSQYYIIAEDDIQPLVESSEITKFIENSTQFKPDLVLFEQGQDLEKNIDLVKETENMYRIFGGGNNTGCYMCSREFGIKLVKHWLAHPRQHVDHSWQKLWKTHKVYFHKPQLFHQKEGYSNQSDVVYRNSQKPFDWNLYHKCYPK